MSEEVIAENISTIKCHHNSPEICLHWLGTSRDACQSRTADFPEVVTCGSIVLSNHA